MTEDEHDRDAALHPKQGEPERETLPEQSRPTGETQTKKPYSDFEGAKAGKGGDHPTPGAGEHDNPH